MPRRGSSATLRTGPWTMWGSELRVREACWMHDEVAVLTHDQVAAKITDLADVVVGVGPGRTVIDSWISLVVGKVLWEQWGHASER